MRVWIYGRLKKQQVSYILAVSVALVIQYTMFMHHIVIWGLSGSTVFLYGTVFGNKLLNMKCVFLIFYTNFVSNISRSNNISARYYYKFQHILRLGICYYCHVLIRLESS